MAVISFLATGRELVAGEVVNTNTAAMASECALAGYELGPQMTVTDEQLSLQSSMSYLLSVADVLIITGGLGPTEDDLTRDVVAAVTERALQFDESVWQGIQALFQKFNAEIPDNNRRQALFPQGATVLDNQHGSASGFKLSHQGVLLFVLPGPPTECLSIFKRDVLPTLRAQFSVAPPLVQRWLLLNASESDVANRLRDVEANTAVSVAYCVEFPFLNLILSSNNEAMFQAEVITVETLLAKWIVGDEPPSRQLQRYLASEGLSWSVSDAATYGRLLVTLLTPETWSGYREIAAEQSADLLIDVSGLHAYWQEKGDSLGLDAISLRLKWQGQCVEDKIPVKNAVLGPCC